MISDNVIIKVEDLKKWFPIRKGVFVSLFSKKQEFIRAVDGVSFEIVKGEVFGLVGESGCGKTTVGKTILRIIEPTSGKVYFKGIDILKLSRSEIRKLRRRMQLIYQDPFESLNPRMTIYNLVGEPLSINKLVNNVDEKVEKVIKALEDVELKPPETFLDKYPHELSGGMKQRVIIAMALSCNPELIIADEPTTALDVIVQAQILKLIGELKAKLNLSLMLITHDLSIISELCNRVAIMYAGKIVEIGDVKNVCRGPLHPYTQGLVAAFPSVREEKRKLSYIPGSPPDLLNPPSGCRFHLRCSKAMDKCRMEEPKLAKVNNTFIACHLYD